jgi:hypothetical protein
MIKNKSQFFLAVAATIILFDVFGALASKSLNFAYPNLVWGSWSIYLISGFIGRKLYGFPSGILVGLIAGFVESTIGWALSTIIGPYLPFEKPHYSFLEISIIIAVVTVQGAILGGIGALLNLVISKLSRTPR